MVSKYVKSTNFCLSLIISQFFIVAASAFYQAGSAGGVNLQDSLINASIEQSIVHNYAAAESAAVELIKLEPDSPAGYFYRAGVVNSMMVDYEENHREEDLFRYLDQAVEIASQRIEGEPDNPWHHFYLGGAKAYLAFQHLRSGHYFSALTNGMKALSELDRAIEIDSTLYDAYLGIGNYKYWITRRTEFIRWFPFIPDKREEGIRLMYVAMREGRYSWSSAASALAWVLIDAERYEETLEVIEKPLEVYPDSRFFLFAQARCLYEMGRYEESIESYTKLLKNIRSAERNNRFNEIGILAKLAEANYALERFEEAERYCREGLNLPLSEEVRGRSKKSLGKLGEILDNCMNK